jgi:Ca2+-transporting ATPase
MASDAQGQYPAWVNSPEETARHYGVDLETGLSAKQVEEQRAKYGWNELEKPPGKPLWKLVLEQFDDMLVKVVQTRMFVLMCAPRRLFFQMAEVC